MKVIKKVAELKQLTDPVKEKMINSSDKKKISEK